MISDAVETNDVMRSQRQLYRIDLFLSMRARRISAAASGSRCDAYGQAATARCTAVVTPIDGCMTIKCAPKRPTQIGPGCEGANASMIVAQLDESFERVFDTPMTIPRPTRITHVIAT